MWDEKHSHSKQYHLNKLTELTWIDYMKCTDFVLKVNKIVLYN